MFWGFCYLLCVVWLFESLWFVIVLFVYFVACVFGLLFSFVDCLLLFVGVVIVVCLTVGLLWWFNYLLIDCLIILDLWFSGVGCFDYSVGSGTMRIGLLVWFVWGLLFCLWFGCLLVWAEFALVLIWIWWCWLVDVGFRVWCFDLLFVGNLVLFYCVCLIACWFEFVNFVFGLL